MRCYSFGQGGRSLFIILAFSRFRIKGEGRRDPGLDRGHRGHPRDPKASTYVYRCIACLQVLEFTT